MYIYQKLNPQLFISLFILIFTTNSIYSQNKTYCNGRYSYCIQYPNDFKGLGESDNGDGQIFISKDRKAEIRAYASLFDDEYTTLKTNLEYAENRSQITYKVVKKNSFIISGYNSDGHVFYQKSILLLKDYWGHKNTKILHTLVITYPKSQLKKYNNYCKIIANSFN